MVESKASAVWHGDLKTGKGRKSTASGSMKDAEYTFSNRFEGKPGSTPEEMIAAAHAACMSMASSAELTKAGMKVDHVETHATVKLETVDGKPTVTHSHLVLRARVPGADKAKFHDAVNAAKEGCPISRLLNAKITLDATLEV